MIWPKPASTARALAAIVSIVVASLFIVSSFAFAQEREALVILHDTHFHGKFGGEDEANIARYATVVDQLRDGRDNVLFVGNGDDLAPSLLASVYRGRHMVEALNAMNLDFNTFGNHEFDYGPDNLILRLQESAFQWVSGNIIDNRTGDVFGAEYGAKRYVVHEMPGGIRVGITGFAPPDTPEVTTLGEHAEMVDLISAARSVVDAMRDEGAHVVLVLSHLCGPDAERLAAEVAGIDAIVGDHCSEALEEPLVVGDTVISRVGDEFEYLGELTLELEQGAVVGWDFALHPVTPDIEPNTVVAQMVSAYEQELDEELAVTIGETAVPLDGLRESVRSEETNLGNFVTDAIREWADTDIALYNGGSIRIDRVVEPGELTLRDLIETLPFENRVVVLEVDGATVRDMLELSVSTVEEGHGRFLQVSGLSFVYDPAAEAGVRVTQVRIGDAELELDATYSVATNNFLAGGGDGYDMLVDMPVLVDAHGGPLDVDVIEEAIRRGSPIAPEREERIATTQ